jgi:hypothetical protein
MTPGPTVRRRFMMEFTRSLKRPQAIRWEFARHGFPLALSICLTLVFSTPARAQYPGGGGTGNGGGTGSTGGYVAPKGGYSNGAAIGAGVGAAAGAGILFLALHHRGMVTGCVQPADDGMRLVEEKKNKSYLIAPGSIALTAGERVELKGKKTTEAGASTFQAKKLVKSLGSCTVDSKVGSSTAAPGTP